MRFVEQHERVSLDIGHRDLSLLGKLIVGGHDQQQLLLEERFDFEMLFGVRRDLQLRLVQQGYRVRVYVPYGREWYPYLVRRLAERPANLGFFTRTLVAEALAGRRNGHP